MISFTWTTLIIVLSPVNILELFSLAFFKHKTPARYGDTDFYWEFLQFVYDTHMDQVHFVRSLIALFNTTFAQM